MVLGDEIAHHGGQAVLAGQVQAVADVRPDDAGTLDGVERIVGGFGVVEHVLDVVARHRQLANIVVVGTGPDEEGVGANVGCGAFAKRPDQHAVVVRTGGFILQALEERVAGLREFEQLEPRGDAERHGEGHVQPKRDDRRARAVDPGGERDPCQLDVLARDADEPEGRHHRPGGEAGGNAGREEPPEPLGPVNHHGAHKPPGAVGERQIERLERPDEGRAGNLWRYSGHQRGEK